MFTSKGDSGRGTAGLEEEGGALWRGFADVWACDGEMGALVVDGADQFGVGEGAGLEVAGDGACGPAAFPELGKVVSFFVGGGLRRGGGRGKQEEEDRRD